MEGKRWGGGWGVGGGARWHSEPMHMVGAPEGTEGRATNVPAVRFPRAPPSCNTHILSQHADTLHNHYCSVEHSKLEVHAQRKRTSVLDQLVSELARDLETAPSREVATSLDDLVDNLRIAVGDGGVIVVGGGYLGQKARPGSKYTPVVQAILKKLAKHFRIVVVDEVRACVRVCVWGGGGDRGGG